MGQLEIDAINPTRTDSWTSFHWIVAVSLGAHVRVLSEPDPEHELVHPELGRVPVLWDEERAPALAEVPGLTAAGSASDH